MISTGWPDWVSLPPQQAIFHSPVLIAQYDYLVASVVLGARCCCSTGDKRLLYFDSVQNIITILLIPLVEKKMSHSGFGFISLWSIFLTYEISYFSQRNHLKITIPTVQFTGLSIVQNRRNTEKNKKL